MPPGCSIVVADSIASDSRIDWPAEAMAIGERLINQARPSRDGSVVWAKPVPGAGEGSLFLGPHLYSGYTGVALFLAALTQATQDSQYRDLVGRALGPLRLQLSHLTDRPDVASKFGFKLGGLVGLGSFIYGLTRIGRLLDDPTLLRDAGRAAQLITQERIEADVHLDVMFGSAGAVLALLLLEQEASSELCDKIGVLDRAIRCGEKLLCRRAPLNGTARGWLAQTGRPLAGFAHGAAGISCALMKLARRTGRADFRDAALEGLEFERGLYCPREKNWRPTLEAEPSSCLVAWCNGAPGIALGRLGFVSENHAEMLSDLEQALNTTAAAADSNYDFLCCGNFGRAEVLLKAAKTLGRPDLLRAARMIAARAFYRARQRGGRYSCSLEHEQPVNPSLFRGLAGIGLTLLGLSETSSLPCVLALE